MTSLIPIEPNESAMQLTGTSIQTNENENKISIYTKGKWTKTGTSPSIAMLVLAFPELDDNYTDILLQRCKANGFTDERFRDAINKVIDNCQYKRPALAEIISYNKCVKLWSRMEAVAMCQQVGDEFPGGLFKSVSVEGALWYVKMTDYQQYKYLFQK